LPINRYELTINHMIQAQVESREANKKGYILPLCIFGFFLGFYLLVARGPITETDGTVNFMTIRAIAEEKSLAISCSIYEEYITVGRNQNCYGKYDVGMAFTAVPLYLLARSLAGSMPDNPDLITPHRLAVSTINQIATALTCALLYILALHLSGSRRLAVELAFLFGLATIAWPYATSFFSQPLVGALLLLALVLVIVKDPPANGYLLAAGAALGWACVVRSDTIPLVGLISLYTLFKCKQKQSWRTAIYRATLFALPIVAGILLYFFFNWWRFGVITQSGYENEGWTTPFLFGLYGLTISPTKGILFFSPLILIALIGLPRLWQKGFAPEVLLAISLFVAQLLIYSAWWGWGGGWVWGPRFLVPSLPFLMIGLIPWLSNQSPRYRLPFLILLTISFFVQIIGGMTDPLVYIRQTGLEYREILANPRYSQLIGQLGDLLNGRVTLIVVTNAFGLFTRTQTLLWAGFSLVLMAISAVTLQTSLNEKEGQEFVQSQEATI
jgi:hypothetical protein